MEKDTPRGPKFGRISEGRTIAPHFTQAGNPGEFLLRRLGEPKNQQAEESSISLAQWESQWQQLLRTIENPQFGWGVPPSAGKPSPWEDAKAFLASFEQVAEACQWPQEEWVTRLLPALRGEAKWAFNSLDAPDREDYGKVKAAILRGDALSREKQRQQFRGFCYQKAVGPLGAYRRLREMCRGWLRVETYSKEQILELLILEQLLNILPPEIQSNMRERGLENCSQAVTLAEEFLLRQEEQVHLEEAAGSNSEADQDPSESEWRPYLIDIKEEDGREASLLASSTDEMDRELQKSSFEIAAKENSEGNCSGPSGIKGKEGTDTKEERDKDTPFQGGGFHEIPIQEETPTKRRKNEELCSNQRIDCREKENECLSVGKPFLQKKSIVPLEQIHSGEKPYNCLECGKSFSRLTALSSHQRIHSGGDEEIEEDKELHGLPLGMKGNFRNPDGPKRQRGNHLAKKRNQPYPCQGGDFCEVIHMGEKTHRYLACGIDFSDQTQHKTHFPKNTSNCLECGRSFSCRSEFLRHQNIHTEGKAYSCSPCGKSFSNKGNHQHHRIHSEEKPTFMCSGSEKNLSDGEKDDVRFLNYSRMKPYKCFLCGMYFRSQSRLLIHHRTHTGEKPFECSVCRKKFIQNSHLQQHLRIHTGEKPFECPVCRKKFNQSFNLRRHQRIHTQERYFECSECGINFKQKNSFRRHQRTHRKKSIALSIFHTLPATVQSTEKP